MNKKIFYLAFFLIIIYACTPKVQPNQDNDTFCGVSMNSTCSSDDECYKFGCSGQLCGNEDLKDLATTCEYRDCFDSQKYGLECKCIDSKCSWA